MQSMRDLDNLISDMRTVETLGDGNSASESNVTSVMIFGQKISAPVLSRIINNLSCSNAYKNLTHTRCFYRFAIDIITWKNDISVSFRIIV